MLNQVIPIQIYSVISATAIIIILIITIRIYLRNRNRQFSEEIENSSYIPTFDTWQNNERSHQLKETTFVDIPTDLNNSFKDSIISYSQGSDYISYLTPYFRKALSLSKSLRTFMIEPSSTITSFIEDFGYIRDLIKRHNELVISHLLCVHKEFFDNCLKYPLDGQQRRSIISEEDNCLVVSSAGSGKTSSIIGKVKYLTEVKGVDPKRILLISYTNKAASEITERIATEGLRGYTFHKLAIDIIGKLTGEKPSICDNTDGLFIEIYRELIKDPTFKENVLDYFVDHTNDEPEWEQRKNERREQLSEQKKSRIKAIIPDMDGNPIYVRSEQEQKISFILTSLGVKFRYEEQYEHQLADGMHSQYCPDFSIYYEKDNAIKRIYLEHFGVDDHSVVPLWFAKDQNISYEEANEKYNDGITWKIAAHEKFGTQLLNTTSADFAHLDIKQKIRNLLKEAGVPLHEKTNDELYEMILDKDDKREKAFIRLIVTFVTLIKSSCKSIEDILRQAEMKKDDRSAFIIKNIFYPMYLRYVQALKERRQLDFTDVILRATDLCRIGYTNQYDYIIVDEFQDISIDRYNFLRVLREGNPPAKLYCVGDDWQSIYRFSGSDMALFSQFPEYFGDTEINKIETTYRFGEPLVSISSYFIQRNASQMQKNVHSFNNEMNTNIEFYPYVRRDYCNTIGQIIATVPADKSILLVARYSFDDYYLSFMYKSIKEGNRFYYIIAGRKIEFLTVHKSKGLEADYVILLQCNNDVYGFPSLVSDDPVLNYVLTKSDNFPYGEERRLFYVAITRAKIKTIVLYDNRFPSVFVNEILHPEKTTENYEKYPNANKRWTENADNFLLKLHKEGKSIKYIAMKMGRSQTSIAMRLSKLTQ